MDVVPLTVRYYRAVAGRCPYEDWLDSLDQSVQQFVDARIARVRRGLLGDSEHLGGGIWELKIDFGPGYRIYFGRDGETVIILLNAGRKNTQTSDIGKAREFWSDYLRRTIR